MANFKELGTNLDVILTKLLNNQTLCKLLYYKDTNPLSQDDLESPEILLYTTIFPYPRTTELLSVASSILIVGFDNFKATSGNNFVGSILYFRILCHENQWQINSGLRPYLIMNEISTMFNNEKVVGIGALSFGGGGEIREGSFYSGFEFTYKITEFSRNFNV